MSTPPAPRPPQAPSAPQTAGPVSEAGIRPEDVLATLAQISANLDGYIERRAQDLAEPIIDKHGAAALERVREVERDLQRAEDLTAELRRQMKPLLRREEELGGLMKEHSLSLGLGGVRQALLRLRRAEHDLLHLRAGVQTVAEDLSSMGSDDTPAGTVATRLYALLPALDSRSDAR